jgi:peptide deformylase
LSKLETTIYPIVKYGEPVLETRAAAVTVFDTPELNKLLDDMFESMYAAKGVGLAAPQIGVSERIAVIDLSVGEDPSQKIVLINPEIVSREGAVTSEEGCLSVPGFREQVTRAQKVTVRAQNAKGESFEMAGEDLLARAFLHETDHLNGTLYLSHVSPLKRDLIRRKVRKLIKAGEWK